MADKSFEQGVKEQLADLQMQPHAAVWLEVEAALHKERQRRWLIWLFLLLAASSGASFWAYYQFNKTEQQINKVYPKKILPKSTETAKEKLVTIYNNIETTQIIKPKKGFMQSKNLVIDKKNEYNSSNKPIIHERGKHTGKLIVRIENDTVLGYNNSALRGQTSLQMDELGDSKLKGVNNTREIVETTTTTYIDTASITTKRQTIEKIVVPATADTALPIPLLTVKNKKSNKWQLGISLDAGVSGIRNSLGKLVASLFDYAGNPSNINFSGNLQFQSSNTIPVIKDAFSFGVQLQLTKPISKKNSLGISVGYSLFQTGTSVGRRIDSTMYFSGLQRYNTNGYYYNSTDSLRYTNQYHFLRAGVDLYTPFRLFKRVQLRWQLGTGINMMVATNGLHFDAINGRLFRNSSLVTKVQTHFSTGFDIAVGKRSFLYIGPHWLYFISNLSKEPVTNQHLFLSAVKATLILAKKKK